MRDILSRNLDELARKFYAGQISLNAESEPYTREEIATFYGDNMAELAALVERMTPAQAAYRLPGTPSDVDASGDESHFDISEIVTHMAVATSFHWWGAARALGHERPEFPRPAEGTPVTGKVKSGWGTGGWRGVSASELAQLLRDTSRRFVGYIESLPTDANLSATSRLGIYHDMTARAWLFLAAIHAYMHLKQVRDMQAQPDFPQN